MEKELASQVSASQESRKLKTDLAKKYIERYKNLVHSHLVAITNKDEEVLMEIEEILQNIDNYELNTDDSKKKFGPSIAKALELVQNSGNWPHERISSLSDLVDEGKTFLFPFHTLNYETRQQVVELCEICRGIDEASLHYIESLLHEEFNHWELKPVNSRISSSFKL